jgi:peptide/nickel transport system substrate-binding protein
LKIYIVLLLSMLIISTLLLTNCNTNTASSTIKTSANTSAQSSNSITTTTTAAAYWWDKFGNPQYGGTITILMAVASAPQPDVYSFLGGNFNFWFESLFEPDWTLDREVWKMNGMFIPDQYWKGNLAESWEWDDPLTLTVHLRQGVHWQDKSPVNGREFTSDDVQQHYNRMLGKGSYTSPSPIYAGSIANWESVNATDKYTVVFKLKKPSSVAFQGISDRWALNTFEAPEALQAEGGKLSDWGKAVGTGPWIIEEYVANSTINYTKNPNYWGVDQRFPENKVPYADKLTAVFVSDAATRIAALRTGKIDLLTGTYVSWQQAQTLTQTNPEIIQGKQPGGANDVSFRMDKAPFTDIRVRQALQLAIDFDSLATNYYGRTSESLPSGLVSRSLTGYCYDYEEWPQSLKDEYAYNPTKAKQLLNDAGFPDGFKTNVIAASTNDLQLLQAIKAQFLDIGVDMTINAMEGTTYQSFARDAKHDQMVTAGGSLNWQPSRAVEQFYSKSPDKGYYMVNDPGYDAIRDNFWAATTSEEAANLTKEIDKYVIEKHWLIATPETNSFAVWQPYIDGYSAESLAWGQGLTYARLWVDQNMKKQMGR